jgi:hypothetical protein
VAASEAHHCANTNVVGHALGTKWTSNKMKIIVTRYWFEFDSTQIKDLPPGLPFGCGVTAYDYNDAISILRQSVFKGQEIPELKNKKENIDIRTLDQRHVIPNMKDPTLRGVWFPLGYEDERN